MFRVENRKEQTHKCIVSKSEKGKEQRNTPSSLRGHPRKRNLPASFHVIV